MDSPAHGIRRQSPSITLPISLIMLIHHSIFVHIIRVVLVHTTQHSHGGGKHSGVFIPVTAVLIRSVDHGAVVHCDCC